MVQWFGAHVRMLRLSLWMHVDGCGAGVKAGIMPLGKDDV